MQDDSSRIESTRTPAYGPWFLYLIECIDGSIYTGIATDVAARYAAHASGKGARYTRAHPPTGLLVSVEYPDRSSALKAEYRIKQLKPAAKRRFAAAMAERTEHFGITDNPGATAQR